MNPASRFFPPRLDLSLLIWAGFLLLGGNALAFIYSHTEPNIRNDVWRHLTNIVIPLLEGEQGLSILWSNHHPAPLLHIIQIVNLKFFGFRLDYHAYLGFFFQTLTTFLLLKNILSTTAPTQRPVDSTRVLAGLLIVCIAFGFNNLDQYTWPLVATVQYLYFFGIVVFLAVDRCVLANSPTQYFIVAGTSLFLVFANADYGTILLTAIIATTFLVYAIERRPVYLGTALTVSAVLIAYRLFLRTLIPGDPGAGLLAKLAPLFEHPLQSLIKFSLGLSTGLVDARALKTRFPESEPLLIGISLLITAIFIIVFIAYLKNNLYRISMTPLALMLISVIFSASVIVNRNYLVADSAWSLVEPRYCPTYKLSMIGMLWALWLLLSNKKAGYKQYCNKGSKILVGVVIGFILCIQGVQIHAAWKKGPYFDLLHKNNSLGIFLASDTTSNTIKLPFVIIGFPKNYQDSLAYLKKNNLNVFSDNFPNSALLDNHVESRLQFKASETAITIGLTQNEQREVPENPASIDATWEVLPNGLRVTNNATQTIYLRIQASAKNYFRQAIILPITSGNDKVQKIHLYRGRQNLFFSLKSGGILQVNTAPAISLEEIELRI